MTEPRIDIVRTVADLRGKLRYWRSRGETIGFVPTMGALHEGHLALVKASASANARTVASLFVNPTQFGPSEDFGRYPRREAEDVERFASARAGLVFAPTVDEMYPAGFATRVTVEGVTDGMEGTVRPGHFEGVATVVAKLLLQCLPDRAYFGEKDYQQLVVVRRMVRDLDLPVAIEGVPTVREADGLALSSRNEYLDAAQRAIAPALYRTLQSAAGAIAAGGDAAAERAKAEAALAEAGFHAVDYFELRDAETLVPLARLEGRPARLLAAARLGPVRLLDNVAVAPR